MTWTVHEGQDYTVLMCRADTTDKPSATFRMSALARRVARLLNERDNISTQKGGKSKRAKRAFAALAAYGREPGVEGMQHGAPLQQVMTDLLSDLMHLGGERGNEVFADALRTAKTHFEAETKKHV